MGIATTIGLDIAKSVFQVRGVDAVGAVVIRRKLTRGRVLGFFENLPRCLVGIEACSSSHYWARTHARGHDVRLLPAQYVKPYLKRQKNDAADAEAICEAVTRPTMRLRAGKDARAAECVDATPGAVDAQPPAHPAIERVAGTSLGVRSGRRSVGAGLSSCSSSSTTRTTRGCRLTHELCLRMLEAQLMVVKAQILENDRRIRASARETELGRRLMEIPGVGPLLASAFVATVADAHAFKSGRCLSAWIGLVPQAKLKRGQGESSAASPKPEIATCARCSWSARWRSSAMQRHGTRRPWLVQLMARRTDKVAAVALANKTSRMVWALMTNGERYREPGFIA